MHRITISLFVVICLISSAYPYPTDYADTQDDKNIRRLLIIYAAMIVIPIVSMCLCCLCCPASPISQCCCPNRKNIYKAGFIVQPPAAPLGNNDPSYYNPAVHSNTVSFTSAPNYM